MATAQPTVISTKAPPASGCLFVLAAPSGGGKTSLVKALLEREPGMRLSVSYTTRPPRPGEVDSVDYHFVDEPTFMALKDKGEFLEHAFVHGNWYATSATWLSKEVHAGHDVLLEIDWQGARQVREHAADSQSVFILPPSVGELERRLRGRKTDSEAVIQRRLKDALADMTHWTEFDHVIVNEDFATALEQLAAVIAGREQGARTDLPTVRAAAAAIVHGRR
jgi:guanylate kinase